jgi:hypothetical protein
MNASKFILLPILIFYSWSINAFCQDFPIDESTGQITYKGVVEVPGVPKIELFRRANFWVSHKIFKPEKPIQIADTAIGKILFNVNYDTYYTYFGQRIYYGFTRFTFEISFKNGKYKYLITDFWHDSNTSKAVPTAGDLRIEKPNMNQLRKGIWDKIKIDTDEYVRGLIQSLGEELKLSKSKESDW